MTSRPRAAVIEIVEKRRTPTTDGIGNDVIAPNEIRINGQSLLAPASHPVKVHEMEIGGDGSDIVLVTLTLFARRIVVEHEDSLA